MSHLTTTEWRGHQLVVTVTFTHSWWRRLLGAPRTSCRRFIGSSTVWHRVWPDGRLTRASTLDEITLADIWETARHRRKGDALCG